jgi:hypothetical protein
MTPVLQDMINFLRFQPNINPSARRFASNLESYFYWKKDLTTNQVIKLVEIYREKSSGN